MHSVMAPSLTIQPKQRHNVKMKLKSKLEQFPFGYLRQIQDACDIDSTPRSGCYCQPTH